MIHVQIPQFEGPLGLLLYLIQKEEMDILDINIHHITRQYLEYIRLMKELDLEVAGEFVAMAATLIHIKSKLLLPTYSELEGEDAVQDPRKELVQKLLEYQKYQEVSKTLYDRPLVGRDVWLRGVRERIPEDEETIILEDNGLFSLIGSYRKVVKRMKTAVHRVGIKFQSIASRIIEIKDDLLLGAQVPLRSLIKTPEHYRIQLLMTFLSALELAKMGFVRVFQTDHFSDVYIEAIKPIERDVIERVHEYDSQNAEMIASQIVDDAIQEEEAVMTQNPWTPDEVAAATDEEIQLAELELEDSSRGQSSREETNQEELYVEKSNKDISQESAELLVDSKNFEPEALG